MSKDILPPKNITIIFFVPNAEMKKKSEKIQTVKGVIIPSEWDNAGDFTKVSLSAIDDEEYLIENGEKFIELINQCISATGTIKKDKRSSKTIHIKKYSVLSDLQGE